MQTKNTLGQKIKNRRIHLGLTQSELASGVITRNMLSLIENEKTMPSYDVVEYLSNKLSLPIEYLYSENDDLGFYEKQEKLPYIKELFNKKSYLHALNTALKLTKPDDEINFIIAISAFNVGKEYVLKGMLESAEKYLLLSAKHSKLTIYPTENIKTSISLYLSLTKNIQSPLLELDIKAFENEYYKSSEIEFFKYVTQDMSYQYKNEVFKLHINAKALIKTRSYKEALKILEYLVDNKSNYEYNAYAIFSIYTDIENLYRLIGDFEMAYRYSSKRISLLNSFKS